VTDFRKKYGHGADVGPVLVSKVDMCELLDLAEKAQNDDGAAVAICGNLSEGYTFVGPYPDWDTASEAHKQPDTWIVTLKPPKARRANAK